MGECSKDVKYLASDGTVSFDSRILKRISNAYLSSGMYVFCSHDYFNNILASRCIYIYIEVFSKWCRWVVGVVEGWGRRGAR